MAAPAAVGGLAGRLVRGAVDGGLDGRAHLIQVCAHSVW
jgi:hypothetical protein